ncbi:MAG TPA: thioredoxin family protein [Pyrinomonadaceae bacterium]|nr:thioredoxin family protein [Pyrinomonadaceae bacterium]
MLRKTHMFARAIFALAALALAAPAAPSRAEGNEPAPVKLGATVEDFRLPDAAGREHTLASLRGKAGTVIIFVSTRCPVSNNYNERMQKLAEDYRAKGVSVVGINSNAPEPAAEIKSHAAEKGLTFPILRDAGARVADRMGATRTPEAFLLDAQNRLVYHGALDNAQNPVMVNTHHLRNAIDAVLAGKTVERPEVKAFGCTIKRG